MKIHRLISILLLVESRGSIKANELAEKLEVSERTIYRDIDTLCEAGIPLTTTTGPKGGVQLMDGYSTGISNLNDEDYINLYLSGIGVQPVKESNMSIKLSNTLMKLQNNMPTKLSNNLETLKNRFHFDESPWWGKENKLLNIDMLLLSVFKSRVIAITYRKFNGESSKRLVHPYGIVVKQLDWYLIGYCVQGKKVKTFKCERIVKADITVEEFEILNDFSLQDYWTISQQSFVQTCVETEYYPVQLKIPKIHTELLSEFEIICIDEKEDELLATINMYGFDHALENISYIEIIEPLELRSSINHSLLQILKKYNRP
ncbi:putative DNA-binding transcriptional regulator YafY [Metabacillus crassostreae]|uniref:helix-turn-helix transcriptional regulator n=1 Tax=Metabacillus crassostreae TaxID=929098 RepID=UPI00195A6D25|nr:YafY family protein [Metabacillus crassostreae]MBM7603048.1 putative DNA-binding transcriptional regulator YafY [Metabacillus crassostreae]